MLAGWRINARIDQLAVFGLLLSLCLTGCDAIPPASVTTATPVFTQTPPASSPSPAPSQTLVMTITPPPTPSLTPSTATPTAPPTPTGSPLETAPAVGQVNTSPNGSWFWQWEPGPANPNFYRLHLASADGSQAWFSAVDPQGFSQVDETVTIYEEPVFWLPKEPYVYLAGRTCCVETVGAPFASGFWLRRLDLTSGRISQVLGAKDGRQSYTFSFSPLGQYLLYTRQDLSGMLAILQLSDQTTTMVRLPPGYRASGVLGWAPDESLAALASCRGGPAAASLEGCQWGLWVLDLDSFTPREYIRDLDSLRLNAEDARAGITWISRTRLNLHMRSGLIWQLNLVTGALICQPGQAAACPGNKK